VRRVQQKECRQSSAGSFFGSSSLSVKSNFEIRRIDPPVCEFKSFERQDSFERSDKATQFSDYAELLETS